MTRRRTALEIRDAKRDRVKQRGFCTGPLDGAPAPGEVGLDYKAECCTCGRRVAITVRGLYAHHKDFQKTARFQRGSFR